MWEASFQNRLTDWVNLRKMVESLPLEEQLLAVNKWWFRAPIVNRRVTWGNWPDPWALLNNNGYCELARALGIVYTIMLIDEPKYTDLKIIQNNDDNLVLVNGGKYILNWSPDEMLNIDSAPIITVKNTIDSSELVSFLQ